MDNYHGSELALMAKMPAATAATVVNTSRPLSAISQATVTESTWTLIANPQPPIDDSSGGGKGSIITAIVTPTKGQKTSALSRFGSLRRKAASASSFSKSSTPTQSRRSHAEPPPSAFPLRSPINLNLPVSTIATARSTPNLLTRPSTTSTVRGRPSLDSSSPIERPPSSAATYQSVEGSDGVGDDDAELRRNQRQLERIRLSRDEAVKRYENRLEYLKTKLKTAEIHERLKKKG